MDVARRNNLRVLGRGTRPLVFSHGLGGDQTAWRSVWPAFEADHRIVLLDHVGSGQSDAAAYDPVRHGSLHGYGADLAEILETLDLDDCVLVGHSAGAMISILADLAAPGRVSGLVLICPSARYMDDAGYRGGFSQVDIEMLLSMVDSDFLGWSRAAAPGIMGHPERPDLSEALADGFERIDRGVARAFARAVFRSDHRADVARCATPALVLQARDDIIVPAEAACWLAATLPKGEFRVMEATGHCPHMSAPDETIAAIRSFLGQPPLTQLLRARL